MTRAARRGWTPANVVTYRVTVRHDPTSTSFAADVVLTDTLPAGLELIPGSPRSSTPRTTPRSVSPARPSSSRTCPGRVPRRRSRSSGNTLTFNADLLDHPASPLTLGVVDEFIIEYQARVSDTAAPGPDGHQHADDDLPIGRGRRRPDHLPELLAAVHRHGPRRGDGEQQPIAGVIYTDLNNNGVYQPGAGETLITPRQSHCELTGTDNLGAPVDVSVTTSTGSYLFDGLRPSGREGTRSRR